MARSKVKWDEANLEENETIKAAINPTKIDEPKTPYHRPMSDEDDDPLDDVSQARMASLDLEPAEASTAEYVRLRACSEPDANASTNDERARSVTPTWSGGSAPGSHGRHTSDEASSGDEDARKEKRRRFEEHRRSHYQMKQALQRAKELLASNEEAEGDEHRQTQQRAQQPTSNGKSTDHSR